MRGGRSPIAAAVISLALSGVRLIAALGAKDLPAGLTPNGQIYLSILGCEVARLLLFTGQGMAWWAVLPGLLLARVSNGALEASPGHAAVQSVPPDRAVMGSAGNTTTRDIGLALGSALISALISGTRPGDLFEHRHQAV